MRTFQYSATLYSSNEGLHDYEKTSGIVHSEREITKNDIRQLLIKNCDDVQDIKISESIYIK